MKNILLIATILFTGIINSLEIYSRKLVQAAERNDIEEVVEALDAGADINYQSSEPEGYSAIIWAAINDNRELAELLIKRAVNLNKKYGPGLTPLMFAANYNHPEIVKLFLERRAQATIKPTEGDSFLETIEKPEYSAIKKVYENFVNPKRANIQDKVSPFLSRDTASIVAKYCI